MRCNNMLGELVLSTTEEVIAPGALRAYVSLVPPDGSVLSLDPMPAIGVLPVHQFLARYTADRAASV